MTVFRRSSFPDRSQVWSPFQRIQAIDATPKDLGLLVGKEWLRCRWEDVRDATLLQKEVFMHRYPMFRMMHRRYTPDEAIALMEHRRTETDGRPQRMRKLGIATRDILTFTALGRTWSINLSSVGFHFENNEILRSILLAELKPKVQHRSIWASPEAWGILAALALLVLGIVTLVVGA